MQYNVAYRRVSRGGGLEKPKKIIRANFKLFHLYFATFVVANIVFSAILARVQGGGLEKQKKKSPEQILSYFTYILLLL